MRNHRYERLRFTRVLAQSLLLVLGLAAPASAQVISANWRPWAADMDAPRLPSHRIWYGLGAQGGVTPNTPQFFTSEFRLGYQKSIFGDSLLTRDSYVGLTGLLDLTVANARYGVMLDFQIIKYVNLAVHYDYTNYYSAKYAIAFGDFSAAYDDAALDQAAVNAYKPNAHRVGATLGLAFKQGLFLIKNKFGFVYGHYGLRAGDDEIYDFESDTLLPGDGFVLKDSFETGVNFKFGLFLGMNYDLYAPIYPKKDEIENLFNPNPPVNQRIGPKIGFTFLKNRWGLAHDLNVAVLVNWWVTHKNHSGAVPWVGLQASLFGDVFGR